MAGFVPVLGVKIIVKGTNQGRPQSWSMWAAKAVPAAPTYSELTALAAAVGGALTGNAFLADFAESYNISAVEAHDASAERGPSAGFGVALVGTAVGANPNSVAAKVFLNPAGSAAFRRPGQTFLPAIPSAATGTGGASDTLTSAYLSAAATFMASMQTAIATVSTYELVAVSRRLNGAPRTTGLIAPVSSVVIRALVATQVRRLRRVPRKH